MLSVGQVEQALALLRAAGATEVTVRFDLGRGVVPVAPLASDAPVHAPHVRAAVAVQELVDEFSGVGARPSRREPPPDDDGEDEGE